MGAAGDDGLPFADHAAEAFVKREGGQFAGGEPADGVAFLAEDGDGGLWGNEHEADVVVEMGGVRAAGGDLVDIEIEGAGGGHDEAGDAGFLEGLAAGYAEDVLIAIAMAAELEPAVKIAMMVEEDAGAVGIDDKGAAGEVGGKEVALETGRGGIEEGEHAVAGGDFLRARGEVEGEELSAEGGAGHVRL